jgi:phospholipase/lecithinase/hemolysin
LLVAGLALGAAACATLFHKPRPDLELPVAERPWRVRCGWVLPRSPDPGAAPGAAGDGWAWAGDAAGRRLVLDGRLEDGFFRVEAVRAASDEDDRDVVGVPATAGAVAEACGHALARLQPPAPRLHARMAARDGEGVDVPMVFPNDPAAPRPASRLVVFGDSLSDTGNLKQRLLVFPAAPYWLGRFANGPNWTDHLADRTGLAIQNHAFGGAAAVKHEDVPAEDVIAAIEQGAQMFLTGSVDRQVRDYLERDLVGGTVRQPAETAYVIWGGANDYISKEPFSGDIRTLLDTPEGAAGYRRIVEEAVAALAEQVRRLYAAGGRRFALVDLPSLGKTPIVLQNTSYQPARQPRSEDARRLELGAKLDELTAHHNRQLERALRRLARELPGATLVRVDASRIVDRMLRGVAPDGSGRPFDYGFSLREREGELRDGRRRASVQDRCYSGGYLGTSDPGKLCAQSRSAFFWDVVHPTSYTHCWVAFFVERELARAGWLAAAPSVVEQRAYCRERAALAS